MKKYFNLLSIFTFILIITSCNNNNENLIPKEKAATETISTKQSNILSSRTSDICDFEIITANKSNIVSIGETKTFTVSDNVPLSTTLNWSIISGTNIEIIGSTNSRTFTVRFNSGFTIGAIRLETNYSGNCNLEFSVYLTGTYIDCNKINTPPVPSPIYSDFGSPVPLNYIQDNLGDNYICTTTINNTLSVPYEPCTSYSWSISPAGTQGKIFPSLNTAIVTVSQPGTYTVTLTTTNNVGTRIEIFKLYAEDCNTNGGGFGF